MEFIKLTYSQLTFDNKSKTHVDSGLVREEARLPAVSSAVLYEIFPFIMVVIIIILLIFIIIIIIIFIMVLIIITVLLIVLIIMVVVINIIMAIIIEKEHGLP